MNDHSRSRLFLLTAASFAISVIMGCGGSGTAELAPLSGVVTMNGDPLPGATVVFRPQVAEEDRTVNQEAGAAESFGKTDENGRYELELVMSGKQGAVVGKNKVVVTLDAFEEILPFYDSSGKDRRGPNPIPPEYNSKTTLELEVPAEGSKNADLKLINPDFKVPAQKANPDQDA